MQEETNRLTTKRHTDTFDHIKIQNFCPNIEEYKKDTSHTDRKYTDNAYLTKGQYPEIHEELKKKEKEKWAPQKHEEAFYWRKNERPINT